MKAFVIKVKENCYWLGGFYGKNNYDDIAHAKIYHLQSQAEKQCNLINEIFGYNAEVVEITIAEGDLEQELVNYKQALNLVCEDYAKLLTDLAGYPPQPLPIETQVKIMKDKLIKQAKEGKNGY